MSKERKEVVRARTDDIVEEKKLGKLGMQEEPLIGQILTPAETTRNGALAATVNFLAIVRRDIVFCAMELTRHMATPTTADCEIGEVFEKQAQGWVVFQISRNTTPT